jgi:hypothetical protein
MVPFAGLTFPAVTLMMRGSELFGERRSPSPVPWGRSGVEGMMASRSRRRVLLVAI